MFISRTFNSSKFVTQIVCYSILIIALYVKQNIDTLERVAGLPAEKIVEAHGTFHTSHCLECKQEYEIEWMKGRSTDCS